MEPIRVDDMLWTKVDLGTITVYATVNYRGNVIVADRLPDVRGYVTVKELVPDLEHEIVIIV